MRKRPLSQHQLELLLYLEDHPLATNREIGLGLGLTPGAVQSRIETLFSRGLVARQPAFRNDAAVANRWQAVPGWMETKSKAV